MCQVKNDFECYYNSFWGDAVYPIPDRDTNWMIKEDIKTFVTWVRGLYGK